MNRAWLVAGREYVENLRTKTFWVGILAFPVILVLAFFLGKLLHEAKDVRTYTVIDRSGWLDEAVQERAAIKDFKSLFEDGVGSGEDSEPLRDRIAEKIAALPEDHALRELLQVVERAAGETGDGGDGPASLDELRTAVLPELLARLAEWRDDEEKLAQLRDVSNSLSMGSYQRRTYADLPVGVDEAKEVLTREVDQGRLFAFITIAEEPTRLDAEHEYYSKNTTDSSLQDWYDRHAEAVVRERRIAELQLSDQAVDMVRGGFELEQVDEGGEAISTAEQAHGWAPMIFVYLLWIAVMTATQLLLTNTVEEKSNRIIEVLLSSVSPLQLMSGKIWGIAATGLTIVGSWVVCALVGAAFLPAVFPALSKVGLFGIVTDPLYLGSFLFYFVGGYLLFAAILVAIGSVCTSLKEAQNLIQPVFIVLIVPLVALPFVTQDPNGTIARVLSYIPLFTPFTMMNRAAGPPPLWEYAATSALLLASIAIAFWAAGKIFRIGILMTGKPPRVGEILGWLKAPVGAVPERD